MERVNIALEGIGESGQINVGNTLGSKEQKNIVPWSTQNATQDQRKIHLDMNVAKNCPSASTLPKNVADCFKHVTWKYANTLSTIN